MTDFEGILPKRIRIRFYYLLENSVKIWNLVLSNNHGRINKYDLHLNSIKRT